MSFRDLLLRRKLQADELFRKTNFWVWNNTPDIAPKAFDVGVDIKASGDGDQYGPLPPPPPRRFLRAPRQGNGLANLGNRP